MGTGESRQQQDARTFDRKERSSLPKLTKNPTELTKLDSEIRDEFKMSDSANRITEENLHSVTNDLHGMILVSPRDMGTDPFLKSAVVLEVAKKRSR